MKTRSNAYWERRAEQRMREYHRSSDRVVRQIVQAYNRAQREIETMIDRIFNRYATDGNLSYDEAQRMLNQVISQNEWDDIKSRIREIRDPDIRRQLLNRLNAPAYRARITRLQALQEQIYLQSKIIADVEIRLSEAGYMATIDEAYYLTMYDLQKGLGVGFEFATIPANTVQTILLRPWSGEHFSSRIWDNTEVLARQVQEIVTAGFMSGVGSRKMAADLAERMDVGKHAANRLVRTETTYMANASEMQSYKEAEIDRYIFTATLDSRTSEVCREHDRKVYSVEAAVPGENMPPLHPYCRSTTRAYFGEETLQGIQRRARDPRTGEPMLVPANMSYNEWHDKYAKGAR